MKGQVDYATEYKKQVEKQITLEEKKITDAAGKADEDTIKGVATATKNYWQSKLVFAGNDAKSL